VLCQKVILALQGNELGIGNQGGKQTTFIEGNRFILAWVRNQCRGFDLRRKMAHVNAVHLALQSNSIFGRNGEAHLRFQSVDLFGWCLGKKLHGEHLSKSRIVPSPSNPHQANHLNGDKQPCSIYS